MVRTQNGPITGQVIEIVHDDGNKQIENQKGTNNKKADKEQSTNFQCGDCGKMFASAMDIKSHVDLVHNAATNSQTDKTKRSGAVSDRSEKRKRTVSNKE